MGPEEKAQYFTNKRLENTERQLAQANFRHEDAMDKLAFENLASRNKLAAAYKDKVEKAIADLRANRNMNANREAMFEYLVGKDAVKKSMQASTTQRRAGGKKIAAARTNSTSSRGNATVSTGGGKSLEKRLENMLL